jgi:hypothetical protein
MKEDILEQLVDVYLKFKGFFTVHNVKFQPSEKEVVVPFHLHRRWPIRKVDSGLGMGHSLFRF